MQQGYHSTEPVEPGTIELISGGRQSVGYLVETHWEDSQLLRSFRDYARSFTRSFLDYMGEVTVLGNPAPFQQAV